MYELAGKKSDVGLQALYIISWVMAYTFVTIHLTSCMIHVYQNKRMIYKINEIIQNGNRKFVNNLFRMSWGPILWKLYIYHISIVPISTHTHTHTHTHTGYTLKYSTHTHPVISKMSNDIKLAYFSLPLHYVHVHYIGRPAF